MGVPTAAAGDHRTTATPYPAAEPYEVFYRAHVERVYRALALTLGDPDLAREAADEAMVRAYVHWHRVRELDNPGGWVYRVGLNWATSWWRKVRRERALHGGPVLVAAPPDPAGTEAWHALARLSLPSRAVVVARVLLDLSTAETAAVLGVAEGTVKSRLARALSTLRAELAGSAPPPTGSAPPPTGSAPPPTGSAPTRREVRTGLRCDPARS